MLIIGIDVLQIVFFWFYNQNSHTASHLDTFEMYLIGQKQLIDNISEANNMMIDWRKKNKSEKKWCRRYLEKYEISSYVQLCRFNKMCAQNEIFACFVDRAWYFIGNCNLIFLNYVRTRIRRTYVFVLPIYLFMDLLQFSNQYFLLSLCFVVSLNIK